MLVGPLADTCDTELFVSVKDTDVGVTTLFAVKDDWLSAEASPLLVDAVALELAQPAC